MKGRRKSNAQEIALQVRHTLAILHKWGIHTLGDLAKLDKEELRARLGPEAVTLWERANAHSTRLLKLVQPPESFEESFEFEHEVETIEPLFFMLRRFLQQLSVRLNALYLVAKEITLRLKFTNQQDYVRRFKIPQPSNDIDLLFRMLQTHLENFKSDHPIIAVALEAQPVKPAQQQFGLFETTLRDPNQLYETLARLTGLLGADRVGTPVLKETHRPDAFQLEPFCWQAGAIDLSGPGRRESTRAVALRRFRPALAASVLLEENKPLHLRSSEISGTALAENGPYIGSGHWWDEKAWVRIEWDLQLGNDVLVRCHQSGETWKLDGVYD
jgi:protein ImuB